MSSKVKVVKYSVVNIGFPHMIILYALVATLGYYLLHTFLLKNMVVGVTKDNPVKVYTDAYVLISMVSVIYLSLVRKDMLRYIIDYCNLKVKAVLEETEMESLKVTITHHRDKIRDIYSSRRNDNMNTIYEVYFVLTVIVPLFYLEVYMVLPLVAIFMSQVIVSYTYLHIVMRLSNPPDIKVICDISSEE